MEKPLITSRRNPLVRRIRSLAIKKGRDEHGLLLLEGSHLLQELLRTGSSPTELVATNNWLESNSTLVTRMSRHTLIHKVSREVLATSLTTKNPDGVAALIPLKSLPKPPESSSFILALDRLQDPGNMGNLFRTALAADIEIVWLALGADPLSQKVLRSSAGAVLHLPYERIDESEESSIENLANKINVAVKSGYQAVATYVPMENSLRSLVPYWQIDWQKPTILVLGNEGSGLHPLIRDCCTEAVTLPHNPLVESLNVASAAVPMLLERRRVKMIVEMQVTGE